MCYSETWQGRASSIYYIFIKIKKTVVIFFFNVFGFRKSRVLKKYLYDINDFEVLVLLAYLDYIL